MGAEVQQYQEGFPIWFQIWVSVPYGPACVWRSSSETLLWVFQPSELMLVITEERAFLVVVPQHWNALLRAASLANGLTGFKYQAKSSCCFQSEIKPCERGDQIGLLPIIVDSSLLDGPVV